MTPKKFSKVENFKILNTCQLSGREATFAEFILLRIFFSSEQKNFSAEMLPQC
jgi:hypothetical protein